MTASLWTGLLPSWVSHLKVPRNKAEWLVAGYIIYKQRSYATEAQATETERESGQAWNSQIMSVH